MTSTTRVNLAAGTSRGLLLDLIRSHAPISRVALAERTGLTQATVSTTVRALLDEGLVLETGRGESTGGKPPTLLTLRPRARYAVGLQLGSESSAVVVVDLAGRAVGRLHLPGVAGREPGAAAEGLAREIDAVLVFLGVEKALVIGLGVAAPGPLDLRAGRLLDSPQLAEWHDVPIRDLLERAVDLPVLLDNDATAAALGDFWSGGLDDSHAHATVYMGSGIGSGVLIDGTVLRGSSSNSGELGQTVLPLADGGLATLEQLAAPAAVVAAGLEDAALTSRYDLRAEEAFAAFGRLAQGAANGDAAALTLVRRSAEHLAIGVLTTANLLDLDSVTLAGPAFEVAGDVYVRAITALLEERFFARGRHGVRVRMSAQIADAAAVGAAALALQAFLAPRAMGLAPALHSALTRPRAH